MSTTDYRGVELDRDQTGYLDPLWDKVPDYCGDDPLRWRNFAMLALRTQGWPFPWISAVFHRHQGQILRCCRQAQREMRRYLGADLEIFTEEVSAPETFTEPETIEPSLKTLAQLTLQLAECDYAGNREHVLAFLREVSR